MGIIFQNIFIQYLEWQFFDVPIEILKGWRNFLKFNLHYFSIIPLLKTLFSPWKRYTWSRERGFSFSDFLEVLFSNLITRIIGAIMRSFLIITGLLAEIIIIFIGIFVFLGWLILPIILIFSIYYGFRMLF
jgi:hypothetical protein